MPLTKLQFKPGVNREATSLANEGGWYDGNNIRFRSGYPEKIGGWVTDTGTESITQSGIVNQSNGAVTTPTSTPLAPVTVTGYNTASFWGVCRNLWAWLNLAGYNLLGLGTNLKYYIQNGIGGAFNDVTPIRYTSSGTTTFTVASKTSSTTTITVTDISNGAQANDFVTFSGVTAVTNDSVITAALLNAEFQVQTVTNVTGTNGYTIIVNAVASSAVNTTLTTTGTVVSSYQITTGSSIYTDNAGWGAGGWGGYTSVSPQNVTITIASPAVITLPTTSLVNGTVVYLTTTGALPTGLTANTVYYVINASNTSGITCNLSATVGGSAINTSGTQSGVQTLNVVNTITGTLNANISASGAVSTITVVSTIGFVSSGVIWIDSEGFSYTGVTSTTFTSVTRAYQNTPQIAHTTGATVYQYPTSATGWGVASPNVFGIGAQLRLWSSANYGQDLIINPSGGQMYYWAVAANPSTFNRAQNYTANSTIWTSSGSFTCDSTTPSLVNYVQVSNASDFVICFGCNDPSGLVGTVSLDPMFIRWSDQQNAGVWLPTPTNQAGSYRLSQGSQIVTAAPAQQGILVWTDNSVYIMQYVGAPYVWGFQVMASDTSIMGPNAVANVNNTIYWMGYNKFYFYNGTVQTLPCAVRQYIFDNINVTQSNQVFAGTNEAYNEVWWFYPSVTGRNPDGSLGTGTPSNPNTITDSYVIYNYLDQTWYYGAMQRTAWLYSPLRQTPVATNYYGQLTYQENGVNDGTTNPASAINAYIQSSDFDIGDGNNFGFVWRLVPDVNFTGSYNPNPTVNMTLLPRQNSGNAYGVANNPSIVSQQNYTQEREYIVQTFTPQIYVRARGRQMALKIQSTTTGVQWQAGIQRLDIRPDGRR